jgi:O-antigen ligase
MSTHSTTRASSVASQIWATLVGWYYSPTLRFALFRGFAITLVGLGLGVVMFVASAASSIIFMILVAAMAISPFLLVIGSKAFGNMKRLLIAVILLEIPIGFDIFLGHNQTMSDINSVTGFNISIATFCLILLYGWWFAEIATTVKPEIKADTPLRYLRRERPLVAYLLACIFSMFFATYVVQSLAEFNLLIQGVLIFIYLVYATRTREDVLLIVMTLAIGLLLQSMIMIPLHFIGGTIELGPISLVVMNSRVAGTLGQPNSAGAYLTLILVITLSVTLMPVRWPYKWLAMAAFGLGTIALLMTFSRGAWIGFAVALGLFWLIAWWRGWLSMLLPVLLFLCAIPILFYLREMLVARLFGDDGGAAESRWPLMILAWRMILDNWLFGVGLNNFAIHLKHYVTPDMARSWIMTVHNKYLLVWAETGLAGIITFLWFLLATLHRGWQVWMTKDRFLAPLALALALAIVGWMAHMAFDIFHNRSQIQLLLVVAALISVLDNLAHREAAERNAAQAPVAAQKDGSGELLLARP